MLTPSFHISQTDELLTISINAPYANWNNGGLEICGMDSHFWFYLTPYFLRLNLPGRVVYEDEPPTEFVVETGEFTVILRKETPGEHFPDLDLLGILLDTPKKMLNIKPSIEVISGDNEESEEDEDLVDEWLIDQEIPVSPSELDSLFNAPRYGFGNQTQGVFRIVKAEFKEIIDLPDPDSTLASQREELRRSQEDQKFCPDHYLADFMEPQVLLEYLTYKTPWAAKTPDTVKLAEQERETLKKFGNKEFLLSKEDKVAALLSLVDIVFAYAYNHRTTLGENTVESAWTINKLSSTLSWFTTPTSMHSAVVSCFRRLLTYTLYRNWDLAQLVLKDTIAILKLGRRQVLKCLVEIHSLFNNSEPRYLLNQLYITDYCIWLQKTSDHKLAKVTQALDKIQILKQDVEFDLEELEQAALRVKIEEEEDVEDVLTKNIQNLRLEKSSLRSSSSSCDSSSSSSGDNSGSSSSGDNSSSLDSDDESSPES